MGVVAWMESGGEAVMGWDLEGNAYGMYRGNLIEFDTVLVVFLPRI